MTPGAIDAAALAVWGGLCSADQRALGARQIHQPIVAGVVAGWILGDVDRGLLVGLWLQLVWAVPLPFGGRLLPDSGSAAVAAVIMASLVAGPAGLLAALLFGLLVARLSIPWERALREANERRERAAFSGPGGNLGRAVALGVAGPFLRGVCLSLVAVPAAVPVALCLRSIGPVGAGHLAALQQGLLGGAAVMGLALLLLHFRSEVTGSRMRWIVGGLLLGAAVRLLGSLAAS